MDYVFFDSFRNDFGFIRLGSIYIFLVRKEELYLVYLLVIVLEMVIGVVNFD